MSIAKRKAALARTGLAWLALALALALALGACATRRGELSLADIKQMPSKQASAYAADAGLRLAEPMADRLGEAPAVLLDALRQMDGNPSYTAYLPTSDQRELFAEYYETLPKAFKAAMESRVIAVYFIRDFEGGGMSDYVFGGDGSMFLILMLNEKILDTSVQDWIAYRDLSPYKEDKSGLVLESRVEGGEKYRALIHTLTHEAAHIYDFAQGATPYVERHLASSGGPGAEAKDLTRGIWKDYSTPLPSYSIPRLRETSAYGLGRKLPLSAAASQYEALGRTPFASLYGAGSWAEDFAEAAAWTWLGERLGLRYSVVVRKGGAEIVRFVPDPTRGSPERQAALRAILGI